MIPSGVIFGMKETQLHLNCIFLRFCQQIGRISYDLLRVTQVWN